MSTQTRKPRTTKRKAAPKALLQELSFKNDYRCFTKDETVVFRGGVNLLVGEQGTGKSSLIGLLRSLAGGDFEKRSAKEHVAAKADSCQMFSFDFEKENPRTQSHFGDAIEFQIASIFASHGQATKRIIEDTRGMLLELDEPAVLLLDEPDMALSPRSAHMLAKSFNELAAAGHQVIAAVHNPIVIASQDEVLSMEHKRWMESKDFLASHVE